MGVHDDIFVARFCLHYKGDTKKAAAAIPKHIAYRRDNAAWLQAPAPPKDEVFSQFLSKGVYLGPNTNDDCPLSIIRAGDIDDKGMMKAVEVQDLVDWFLYAKEQAYVECDQKTRAT